MAVYESIRFCLEYSVDTINIEHNSKFVYRALTTPGRRRDMYQRHRNEILALAKQTDWTALRVTKKEDSSCEYDTLKAVDHLLGQYAS